MSEQTLARARAGDEHAFRELTDPYRRELQLHVYRIVGSAQDAEDLLQETLLAAWRGLERHEIQLDQKLLVVRGSKGVIGCPYLNVGSFEKFGEACAIIPAVDTAGMLDREDRRKAMGTASEPSLTATE